MAKKTNNIPKHIPQKTVIEKTFKAAGFLFPETVDEVKEFERLYGTTDVTLPFELQEPTFLYPKFSGEKKVKVVKLSEKFAMAAREGAAQLPDEIKERIIRDIKLSEKKGKKRRK